MVAAIIAWWVIGMGGFVYWWTTDLDLTVLDIPLAVGAGLLGPISWLAGGCIHGGKSSRVLIPRQKR